MKNIFFKEWQIELRGTCDLPARGNREGNRIQVSDDLEPAEVHFPEMRSVEMSPLRLRSPRSPRLRALVASQLIQQAERSATDARSLPQWCWREGGINLHGSPSRNLSAI